MGRLIYARIRKYAAKMQPAIRLSADCQSQNFNALWRVLVGLFHPVKGRIEAELTWDDYVPRQHTRQRSPISVQTGIDAEQLVDAPDADTATPHHTTPCHCNRMLA